MSSEITFSKGGTTVTVYTTKIAENFTNKLINLTIPQVSSNQAVGPKLPKILDLLRITHQFVMQCYITGSATKTAKEIKDDLVTIYNGGSTNGGVVVLTYDGDTINGYIEKLNFVEASADNPSTTIKDFAKYEVAVTFVEGVEI